MKTLIMACCAAAMIAGPASAELSITTQKIAYYLREARVSADPSSSIETLGDICRSALEGPVEDQNIQRFVLGLSRPYNSDEKAFLAECRDFLDWVEAGAKPVTFAPCRKAAEARTTESVDEKLEDACAKAFQQFLEGHRPWWKRLLSWVLP